MDCGPSGSSVYRTSKARTLEVLPFPSPGDLPRSGIESAFPALAGGFFTTEPLGKLIMTNVRLQMSQVWPYNTQVSFFKETLFEHH